MIKGREEVSTLDELDALQNLRASMERIVKKARPKACDILETQFWEMIQEWTGNNKPNDEDVKRCRNYSYYSLVETGVYGNYPSMTFQVLKMQ